MGVCVCVCVCVVYIFAPNIALFLVIKESKILISKKEGIDSRSDFWSPYYILLINLEIAI